MFDTNHRLRTHWHPALNFYSCISGFISRRIARWIAERNHERAVVELYSLPDYLLRDMGLDRSQIHAFVAEGPKPKSLASETTAPLPIERTHTKPYRSLEVYDSAVPVNDQTQLHPYSSRARYSA
jgi:uncharacterized protein YjiS (DUF1127 family)